MKGWEVSRSKLYHRVANPSKFEICLSLDFVLYVCVWGLGGRYQFCCLIQWGSDLLLFVEEDILTAETLRDRIWNQPPVSLIPESVLFPSYLNISKTIITEVQWHSQLTLDILCLIVDCEEQLLPFIVIFHHHKQRSFSHYSLKVKQHMAMKEYSFSEAYDYEGNKSQSEYY